MKKALINLTAVFAAAAMCLCTACGGGDSEEYTVDTFKGVVSEQSYKTKDTAVQAFIAEEVGGKNLEAVFIEYIKEADLTQAEIAELNVEQRLIPPKRERRYILFRIKRKRLLRRRKAAKRRTAENSVCTCCP